MPTPEQDAIEKIARARNITHLVHFTRVENLNSIFEFGLLPKSDSRPKRVINNDKDKYDDCVCFSIIHPSNMFGFLRHRAIKAETLAHEDWCVIVLKPDVLWQNACRFFPINAVSKILRSRPPADFVGAPALEAMFAEKVINHKEETETRAPALLPSLTTNSQAEVHVISKIDMANLEKVHFHPNVNTEDILSNISFPNHVERIKSSLFFSTRDYWLKREI